MPTVSSSYTYINPHAFLSPIPSLFPPMKEGGMGKMFGLRRVLISFNSCRPKDHSAALSTTSAAPICLSSTTHQSRDPPPPPPTSPNHPLRRLATVVTSAGCRCTRRRSTYARRRSTGCRDRDTSNLSLSRSIDNPAYVWCKNEKWLAVSTTADGNLDAAFASSPRHKIDAADDGSEVFYLPAASVERRRREADARRRRRQGKTKMKKSRSHGQASTSSADSGWFSSEDDDNENDDGDETDTFLSSFETDAMSEVMNPRGAPPTPVPERAAAVLRRVASGVDEADAAVATEGFAVMKRSRDPRGDFRRSMAEMVLEKRIYDAPGLEQLLHCFLSLNSALHHAAIISAFADIWDAIYPATPAVRHLPEDLL